MVTQRVSLKDVRFYSPIGYYEEEQIIGTEFFINVDVYFPFENSDSENLNNTINYEGLYQILVEVMRPKRKLIESAVEDILHLIQQKYMFVDEIYICIRKINPAFGGDLANSEIALHYVKEK